MFKEAFVFFCILFLIFIALRILMKKNKKITGKLVLIVLTLSCFFNILYNTFVTFPDFYMDTVSGVFRYGTFSGNLFAFSDQFMFQDEIIFPVLHNREVLLDETASFYEKFFSLYADSVENASISEEEREIILSNTKDFNFSHEFTCIGIMDYVKDSIPEALTSSFEKEIYPTLYINTVSLKKNKQLLILMDKDYSIYVMSKDYYDERIGGSSHA